MKYIIDTTIFPEYLASLLKAFNQKHGESITTGTSYPDGVERRSVTTLVTSVDLVAAFSSGVIEEHRSRLPADGPYGPWLPDCGSGSVNFAYHGQRMIDPSSGHFIRDQIGRQIYQVTDVHGNQLPISSHWIRERGHNFAVDDINSLATALIVNACQARLMYTPPKSDALALYRQYLPRIADLDKLAVLSAEVSDLPDHDSRERLIERHISDINVFVGTTAQSAVIAKLQIYSTIINKFIDEVMSVFDELLGQTLSPYLKEREWRIVDITDNEDHIVLNIGKDFRIAQWEHLIETGVCRMDDFLV